MSSRCSSACGRSSLAMSGTSAAEAAAISPRACFRSSAVCTKLTATMSTPSERPNFRSSTSFSVIAEAGSGTPGALIPLCSPISPPSTTVVSIVGPVGSVDAQLDQAVGEEQPIAGTHGAREPFEGRGQASRPARKSPVTMQQLLPGLELHAACRRRGGRCGSSDRPGPGEWRPRSRRAPTRRGCARTSRPATLACRVKSSAGRHRCRRR